MQSSALLITDARQDARFGAVPCVAGEPGIRIYAGLALTGAQVRTVGTLCVLEVRPRAMSGADLAALRDLAAIAEQELRRSAAPDISRAAGDRATAAERSRNDMVHALSHDFRSTLSGIIGFAELMGDSSFSPEQTREFAGDMHGPALRLNEMVGGLLELGLLPDGG